MTHLRQGYGGQGGSHGHGGQSKVAALIAVAVAIALATFSVVRGTWAVGGSDSSCYALMAKAFAGGELQPHSALADAPWPDVPRTTPNAASPTATATATTAAIRPCPPEPSRRRLILKSGI